jgi:flagellar hook-associated protein 2
MVGSIGFSLGIGSGLDIKSIVDGLAQAERAPKEALIKRREEANSARVSALADAAAGIDSFTSALSGLIGGGSLFSQPSVSDPNLLGATAVPGARLTELSAQLEVMQLAKAQTLQSVSLANSSAPVGQGDLTLTTAAGSFTVTIDASNDSLSGLAAAINGKAAGVTASIVTDSTGARLVLKGATGEANAFTLSVPAGTATGRRALRLRSGRVRRHDRRPECAGCDRAARRRRGPPRLQQLQGLDRRRPDRSETRGAWLHRQSRPDPPDRRDRAVADRFRDRL